MMAVMHAQEAAMVAVGLLVVPQSYDSKPRAVDDDILRNSIRLTGIQQPLIVARLSDEQYVVIDGVRRLRIAKDLPIPEVPCVIDVMSDNDDEEGTIEYRNRIRFMLDEHRQDLRPTQRAALIEKLRVMFDMSSKDVAAFLGVTPGTIANWMLIRKVIPEVQTAIDSERIAIHSARALAGMTETGQREVWDKHQHDMERMSGELFHKFVRRTFPPKKVPEMYVSPEVVARKLERLKRGKLTRKIKKRPKVSAHEKAALRKDVELRRIELNEKKSRIAELNEHIDAAVPVIEALQAESTLWNDLPKGVRADFEDFVEAM